MELNDQKSAYQIIIFCIALKTFTSFHFKAIQVEECVTQNSAMQVRITQLESSLATREQELIAHEAKYRKCVEKAKEVIRTLDPRIANGL